MLYTLASLDLGQGFNIVIVSLILLQKTLIHIEGMGREIYADLDFWGLAEPYIDQWINKQFSPLKLKEFLEDNHYEILDKASSLPGEIFDLLDNIKFLANDGKKNCFT